MTNEKNNRALKKVLIGAGFVGLAALFFLFVRSMLNSDSPVKKPVIQQISLLRPPPPPPPKPEEKPPEPEIKKEEVKIDQPQPEPETPQQAKDDTPAGKDLGVDADGGAGADGFGLIGKKGGRDLFGGGGGKFSGYTGLLKQRIQEALAKDKRLRNGDYKAIVKVWLKHDGSLDHFELTGSSGNPETDAAIKVALTAMPPLRDMPPDDMPQPVKLRISSRT